MKFGFFILFPTPELEYTFERTKKAEEFGFDSVFYADHTINLTPDPGFCYDAYMFLTSLAMITKKLKLCTGVSDCHRYHPALMAQKVASLDNISKGRAMFGVGAGEKMNIDMYGLSRAKSVSKLREYIELIRAFWGKRRVNKKSEFWGEIKKAYIQIKPIQKLPPIYIAANGPKTRQLTGELGDGWFPINEAPWTYKENKKEVIKAAKNAGRDPTDLDYIYDCLVAIDDKNPDNAIKVCEPFRMVYLLDPKKTNQIYPNLNLPTKYSMHNFDMHVKDAGDILSSKDTLPEKILQDTNCIGTTEDVIKMIERYEKAGATHMVFLNRGPNINRVYEIFRDKIIPYFKETDK